MLDMTTNLKIITLGCHFERSEKSNFKYNAE